jgi:hypothetical protein
MKNNSFIMGGYLPDVSVCDRIISLHQNSDKQSPAFYFDKGRQVKADPAYKDSVDVSITNYKEDPVMVNYVLQLQSVVNQYIEQYPNCNRFNPWGMTEPINIQYYKPGAGYHAWHCERSSTHPIASTRHLVFMTYLNDVTDGGETEFLHQEIKIQPKKGLTLIWPSDWTHIHRGITSMTQEKYIATGWFNWLDAE